MNLFVVLTAKPTHRRHLLSGALVVGNAMGISHLLPYSRVQRWVAPILLWHPVKAPRRPEGRMFSLFLLLTVYSGNLSTSAALKCTALILGCQVSRFHFNTILQDALLPSLAFLSFGPFVYFTNEVEQHRAAQTHPWITSASPSHSLFSQSISVERKHWKVTSWGFILNGENLEKLLFSKLNRECSFHLA